jgi:hypothetical protein
MSRIDIETKDVETKSTQQRLNEDEINALLDQRNRDELIKLAVTGQGLVNSKIRQRAWPIILGIEMDASENEQENRSTRNGTGKCKDEDQVRLDVDRSFVYYPVQASTELREQLKEVICTVLHRNPLLSYYQGYHDVAQVVLLVMQDTGAAVKVLEYISLHYLRDFMLPSLDPTLAHLAFLEALTTVLDPVVGEILHNVQPYYGLSATITLFAHNVRSFPTICRLFDYVLAGSAASTLYTVSAFVAYERRRVKEAAADADSVHSTLCNLGENYNGSDDNLRDELLMPARRLELECPLSSIKVHWDRLSSYSVLKTPPLMGGIVGLASARILLSQQCAQVITERERSQSRALSRKHASATQIVGRNHLLIPRTLLGLSVCCGVLGVVATAYRHDICSVWGQVIGYLVSSTRRDYGF